MLFNAIAFFMQFNFSLFLLKALTLFDFAKFILQQSIFHKIILKIHCTCTLYMIFLFQLSNDTCKYFFNSSFTLVLVCYLLAPIEVCNEREKKTFII